mgnify:CR=1 FL=1
MERSVLFYRGRSWRLESAISGYQLYLRRKHNFLIVLSQIEHKFLCTLIIRKGKEIPNTKGEIVMDGNNYNNNQNGSSDSFYSYNNGSQSNQQTEHANEGNVNQYNNSYQNTNSYSQNAGYQQGSAYQNGTYQNTGYQQNGAYQNGGYQNTNGAFYQNAQTTGKKTKRKKRERKPGRSLELKLSKMRSHRVSLWTGIRHCI